MAGAFNRDERLLRSRDLVDIGAGQCGRCVIIFRPVYDKDGDLELQPTRAKVDSEHLAIHVLTDEMILTGDNARDITPDVAQRIARQQDQIPDRP